MHDRPLVGIIDQWSNCARPLGEQDQRVNEWKVDHGDKAHRPYGRVAWRDGGGALSGGGNAPLVGRLGVPGGNARAEPADGPSARPTGPGAGQRAAAVADPAGSTAGRQDHREPDAALDRGPDGARADRCGAVPLVFGSALGAGARRVEPLSLGHDRLLDHVCEQLRRTGGEASAGARACGGGHRPLQLRPPSDVCERVVLRRGPAAVARLLVGAAHHARVRCLARRPHRHRGADAAGGPRRLRRLYRAGSLSADPAHLVGPFRPAQHCTAHRSGPWPRGGRPRSRPFRDPVDRRARVAPTSQP